MEWHDPNDDVREKWDAAMRRLFSGGGASRCPSCGSANLRYFFRRHDPPQPRGGFWAWCPACRSYEHGSVSVPEWWHQVEVPLDQLFHDPAWLDENWSDDWLDRQPVGR